MTNTYCTAADVLAQLNLSAWSSPSQAQVESRIEDIEDEIDYAIGHSFKSKTVTKEYHDFPDFYENVYEGITIYLKHRAIRLNATFQLDTTAGDKLEIFNGSTWEDWTAIKTDSRSGDFWVEPEKGILYLRNYSFFPRKQSIRITYRYGESSIPRDIKRAAILLTAASVVDSEDFANLIPDTGTSQIPYETRSQAWRRIAENIIERRAEPLIF